MQADEYDILLRDPSDFWMRYYLPRVAGVFGPLKTFPPITDYSIIPIPMLMPLTRPETQAFLQRLLEAGKELSKWSEAVAAFAKRGLEAGYPASRGGGCLAPFDTIGDLFRGTKGIMLDMYRQPETLMRAMDLLADIAIESAISSVNTTKGLTVTFTLHKGDDTFLSLKQFEKFYWPSLRKILLALIDEGIIPILFAEGSYNTRLEIVNEFPKGTVAWRFDKTDMARAKKVLGDKSCIAGNIPSSILCMGTPGEVKAYCRKLIEDCGKEGGYILAAGASADNINPDNVRAMMEAAKEYGVYK
jgi:uroporphyrinogen-III decarboxylase